MGYGVICENWLLILWILLSELMGIYSHIIFAPSQDELSIKTLLGKFGWVSEKSPLR